MDSLPLFTLLLPDGVASSHPDPLWNGTVLLELLGQLGLDSERLVGRLECKEEFGDYFDKFVTRDQGGFWIRKFLTIFLKFLRLRKNWKGSASADASKHCAAQPDTPSLIVTKKAKILQSLCYCVPLHLVALNWDLFQFWGKLSKIENYHFWGLTKVSNCWSKAKEFWPYIIV